MSKILFVVTGTNIGGAEGMLLRLCIGLRDAGHEVKVISLTTVGAIGERMRSAGIDVSALGMDTTVRRFVSGILRLARHMRDYRPQVVQTWMYHADLVGGLVGRFVSRTRIVWGIRQSNLDRVKSKKTTILITKICGLLSSVVPHAIVCCSHASMNVHVKLGYKLHKMVYLPNGFDPAEFKPNELLREQFCDAHGIDRNAILIGNLSRYDPQKDIGTFLAAAAEFVATRGDVVFVMAGTGISKDNTRLTRQIDGHQLSERVLLLGEIENVASVLPALDILTLSSAYGEGFPNVIAEAMLSGVPCVATNVGDVAEIMGSHGFIVPIGDSTAIATAWTEILTMNEVERQENLEAGRERIRSRYGIDDVVEAYGKFYRAFEAEAACAA